MPRKAIYLEEVERILDTRILRKPIRVHHQYFVEWKSELKRPNSWVYQSQISSAMIKEFLEKNPPKKEEVADSVIVTPKKEAVTVADSKITTRAAARQRVDNSKKDKSTQTTPRTDKYCFERYDYA